MRLNSRASKCAANKPCMKWPTPIGLVDDDDDDDVVVAASDGT